MFENVDLKVATVHLQAMRKPVSMYYILSVVHPSINQLEAGFQVVNVRMRQTASKLPLKQNEVCKS